ncbi:MFS general substrate transporter [Ganoderma sinense ZZ0214-1]|uniref:MFS general substrate transporter n=1 Tax=Ganoderma sinense ZZ0214-1 TaxID=1077348 RepID=A0A2G8S0S9_9APHY|nr:MFS general substrate transporter [Ganoderma sinense ZZ0214-1]
MADDDGPAVLKESTSMEKAERDAFEVDEGHRSELFLPADDKEIYQFLVAYQEGNAGRLVLDPRAAPGEFGERISERLKLSEDGSKILWPQPTDDPRDPQNWSTSRKTLQLTIATLAAIVPDFDASIGITSVFAMAQQFDTTPDRVNQLGQRACAQVSGLYVVTDLFPVHLQARKLSIWTMGFVLSPVLAPFLFGFLVARANWRWSYGIGTMYDAIVVFLIAFFLEETMYDRHLANPHPLDRPSSTLRYRVEMLVGATGLRMARFRPSWKTVALAPLKVVWRPHLFAILWYEGVLFGLQIGLHVTNAVILANPPPTGYGYGQIQIAATYASSLAAVLIGEVVGRYLVDWLLEVTVRRNNGVFEADCRLWACYPSAALFVIGFILEGAAFQFHLHIAVLVVGWLCAQIAVMMNTSAGEISALINLARSLGGFSVSYFQVDWVTRNGALQAFGAEAGIVAGLFVLVVPILQIQGQHFRTHFAAK